jgi:probable rRNA maturation factor
MPSLPQVLQLPQLPQFRIAVQNPSRSTRVPAAARVTGWVRHALGPVTGRAAARAAEITVRFVTRREAIALNEQFRQRDYAPNVLSFPYDDPAAHRSGGRSGSRSDTRSACVSGDIAICPAIVAVEARSQGKPFEAHLVHMVVHGVLHLRGYDHIEPRDAARMERIESRLVTALGLADPWAAERADGP